MPSQKNENKPENDDLSRFLKHVLGGCGLVLSGFWITLVGVLLLSTFSVLSAMLWGFSLSLVFLGAALLIAGAFLTDDAFTHGKGQQNEEKTDEEAFSEAGHAQDITAPGRPSSAKPLLTTTKKPVPQSLLDSPFVLLP